MDYQGDFVSDLQHSLMAAHGLMKKMKAISRQLNASHTLLLMKQSTSNEQVAEYVNEMRQKLELFHEEMILELNKAFQEKTAYLNTCMQQLQQEEGMIGRLCNETECLLKQVTKTITPMHVQRGKTLLDAYKIMSIEHSADLELDEDVICLDFVPLKPADEFSSFGSIRVRRKDSAVVEKKTTILNHNQLTAARSTQTEILFKDYCPFCGRTYSRAKKDIDIQTCVTCIDCGTQSDLVESETFWEHKWHEDAKLAIDRITDNAKTRREYLESLKQSGAPNIRLSGNTLENVGIIKQSMPDQSSSSLQEDSTTYKSSPRKPYLATLCTESSATSIRRRMPLTGKKLENMNKKLLEEVWSSDEETIEATLKPTTAFSYAAVVKPQSEGDGEDAGKKKTRAPAVVDNTNQNYIQPPSKVRPKKPMIAAESLSMLTGLMNTAKAENVIQISRKEIQKNSDWWGDSTSVSNLDPQMSPIKLNNCEKASASSGCSVGSAPECWLDEESDGLTCSSITSTPKHQKGVNTDQNEAEFRLRRPSVSLVTSPYAVKPNVKTAIDSNNNNSECQVKDVQIIKALVPKSVQPELDKVKKLAEMKFEEVTDVTVKAEADSGWEEDLGASESKDLVKDDNQTDSHLNKYTVTVVKGSQIWTETKEEVTKSPQRSQPDRDHIHIVKDGRQTDTGVRKSLQNVVDQRIGHRAKDDWEPMGGGNKNINNMTVTVQTAPSTEIGNVELNTQRKVTITGNIGQSSDFDWEKGSQSDKRKVALKTDTVQSLGTPVIRKPAVAMLTTPNHCTSELSPVAMYINKMTAGNISKILPPIPAKLTMKIGGKDSLYFPIGVATTCKGDIIVADTGNHLVKIYAPDGKLSLTIGSNIKPSLQRPSAIVLNKKNEIFVKDDKCISVFDLSNGSLLRKMGAKQLLSPYGLSFTPEGHLLTLDVDRHNPRIVIFSQEGDLINSFPCTPLQGRVPQTKCRFLHVNQNTLVVSDLGRHVIYMTDLQGRLKTYFGRGGYGNGEFYEPSGVIVDNTGNMIIADSKNDRVQIFRPDGGFVCIVGFSEPIKRPSDIHLTSDGRLIVVNFLSHQLKVYKLGDS